ncbi:DUF4876 domain-containing protein [Marinifilum fragile]|uniref:DUF4876 domain-containing protein n=1 Tax=Marinifilum fragile TaxID=570161 RepID=UPI002AA76F6A|nr:DUF4876 domain-containing protein [Marinifilum fragile]
MKIRNIIIAAALLISAASCDDNDAINKSFVDVKVSMPSHLEGKSAELENAVFTLENVNTGEKLVRETSYIPQVYFDLEDGLYNISVEGTITYSNLSLDNKSIQKETGVRAKQENIKVVGGDLDLNLEFVTFNPSQGFLISEIFFADTRTPEGKQYAAGDQYIEIYNNSDKVLYADGLCIAETELMSVEALNEYTPDIRNEAVPVSSVYMIPGSGNEYPVQPGETLLISDIAINHKEANKNSFDLSKSNFEWFDGEDIDTDVPEVKNMIKMVSTSKSVWHLHSRGFKSYILFKFDKEVLPEEYVKDYAYHYEYLFVFNDMEFPMDYDAWKVPNEFIIDAVQCSTPSEYQWMVMSSSLDASYTHSGDGDASRYGRSIKRKVLHVEGDRSILQDTNDSASDFIPTAEPSPGIIETLN